MNVTPDTRLALDPQYRLKNDVDRAVLITRPEPLSFDKPPVSKLLRPREAIFLALLDGDRTVRDLGGLWADLSHKSPEDASREVDSLIGRFTTGKTAEYGFLIEVDETNRETLLPYDPVDFVVPRDRRIDLADPRLRRPHRAYYLPTLFCPQKCVYCYAKVSPRFEPDWIPLERLREIFAELKEIGIEVLQFSGGDPFSRKDIFEILEAVFDAGLVPYIPTKLGLNQEDAVRLRALGVEQVQVSMDSAEPDILDHMVGVSGYHNRVFRVLENLRQADLKVRVNTVLTPLNAPSIGGLIDFLGGLGHVINLSLTPYGRSLFCHSDELFLSREQLAQVDEERRLRAPLYPHMTILVSNGLPQISPDFAEQSRRFEKRSLCSANRQGFVILPDGRVTACEELYDHPSFLLGDLRRQSVMEMWNSPEALALVHPDQSAVPDGPCKDCGQFAQCNLSPGRCWRDALKAYGWDKPHYPDPRCPMAPAGNRLS